MSSGATDSRQPFVYRAAAVVIAVVMLATAGACMPAQPSPAGTSTTSEPPTPSPTTGPEAEFAVLADLVPPARVANASLEVGDFGHPECPAGRIAFREGGWQATTPRPTTVEMGAGAVGDVNADGVEDTVVVIICKVGGVQGNEWARVLAYAGTGLSFIGSLGAHGSWAPRHVTQIVVVAEGVVEIDYAVMEPFTVDSRMWRERWQWNGSAFIPVSEVDIAHEAPPQLELVVDPTGVELAPGTGPQMVRVTVHNRGSLAPSQPLWLAAGSDADLVLGADPIAGPLGRRGGRYAHHWLLLVRAPEPGEAVTVTLRVSAPTAVEPGAALVLTVQGNANTHALGEGPVAEALVDLRAGA